MGKHLDYVQQADGTYKWELAEIPAVKSTPVTEVKTEVTSESKKKGSKKKSTNILSE